MQSQVQERRRVIHTRGEGQEDETTLPMETRLMQRFVFLNQGTSAKNVLCRSMHSLHASMHCRQPAKAYYHQ